MVDLRKNNPWKKTKLAGDQLKSVTTVRKKFKNPTSSSN